jgi:hypothetical protein
MLLWNAAVTGSHVGKLDHVSAAITTARVETDAFVRPAGQSPAARPHALRRITTEVALLLFLFAVPSARAADCLPIHETGQHIGETKCVTGKVIRVTVGLRGVHFLNFCEDEAACPFTVVIFSNDLADVGDVGRLAGRTIEIRGALKTAVPKSS